MDEEHLEGTSLLTGDRFIATVHQPAFEAPGLPHGYSSNAYSRVLQEQMQLGGAVMRYDVSRTPDRPSCSSSFQLPTSAASHYISVAGDSDAKPDSSMCTPRKAPPTSPVSFAVSALVTPPTAKGPRSTPSAVTSRTPSPPPAFFSAVARNESPLQGVPPFQSPSPAKPFRTPSSSLSLLRHRHREGVSASRILNADGISSDLVSRVLCWNASSLIVALSCSVYSWIPDGPVRVLMDHRAEVTALTTFDDVGTNVSYTAVGLNNGLVHVGSAIQTPSPKYTTMNEHVARVTSVAIHFYTMISVSVDAVMIVYDLRAGHVVCRTTLASNPLNVQITRDGNHAAIGCSSGLLVLHSANWADAIRLRDSSKPIRCLSWSPHKLAVLAYAVGSELIVQGLGTKESTSVETNATIVSLLWSVTTPELVVGLGAPNYCFEHLVNSIIIYDMRSDGPPRIASMIQGHHQPPQHLALSPDGSTLVTGASGHDSTLRFWEVFPAAPSRMRLSPTSNLEERLR